MWRTATNPDGITVRRRQRVTTNATGPDWLVLGNEGGFLANPVNVPSKHPIQPSIRYGSLDGSLITGNAERWDVIVDFNGFAGQNIILYSDAPAPFPGGDPRNDYYWDTRTQWTYDGLGPDTRQLMRVQGRCTTASGSAADPSARPSRTGHGPSAPGIDPFLANRP